ncbi:MAG: antibiotic biosynthesis monooxygenase [Chitinophagaceae bacterium]
MITRIWHGRTTAKNADIYLEYIQETGLKDYLATVGNISAKILRKIDGEICHFYTITEWKDIESIINFAGNKYEKARYYPEDKEYLLELEGVVNHYETFY